MNFPPHHRPLDFENFLTLWPAAVRAGAKHERLRPVFQYSVVDAVINLTPGGINGITELNQHREYLSNNKYALKIVKMQQTIWTCSCCKHVWIRNQNTPMFILSRRYQIGTVDFRFIFTHHHTSTPIGSFNSSLQANQRRFLCSIQGQCSFRVYLTPPGNDITKWLKLKWNMYLCNKQVLPNYGHGRVGTLSNTNTSPIN